MSMSQHIAQGKAERAEKFKLSSSVWQCLTVFDSVWQCLTVSDSVRQGQTGSDSARQCQTVSDSVIQFPTVSYSVSQSDLDSPLTRWLWWVSWTGFPCPCPTGSCSGPRRPAPPEAESEGIVQLISETQLHINSIFTELAPWHIQFRSLNVFCLFPPCIYF